jgi:hypothetical protein
MMTSQSNPLDRAAEWDGLMRQEPDEVKKTIFRLLRDMWVALANESGLMSAETLAQEVAAISEIEHRFRRDGGTH